VPAQLARTGLRDVVHRPDERGIHLRRRRPRAQPIRMPARARLLPVRLHVAEFSTKQAKRSERSEWARRARARSLPISRAEPAAVGLNITTTADDLRTSGMSRRPTSCSRGSHATDTHPTPARPASPARTPPPDGPYRRGEIALDTCPTTHHRHPTDGAAAPHRQAGRSHGVTARGRAPGTRRSARA
jgi:hypothetical protein